MVLARIVQIIVKRNVIPTVSLSVSYCNDMTYGPQVEGSYKVFIKTCAMLLYSLFSFNFPCRHPWSTDSTE